MGKKVEWGWLAQKGYLASGIDPGDRKGRKNYYIDLLQKMALDEVLELNGDEAVVEFGCGSGRIAYWIAPRVNKVVGLEVTPEMIELAEKNRSASNAEFILYDGSHFPGLRCLFDLILSVGVLQIMRGEVLKEAVSELTKYLKPGGRICLIEQVSDNPRVDRPKIQEYLEAFKASKLECLHTYSIRKGRWWMLYLIRYGFVPPKWFPSIAAWELREGRGFKNRISYYRDFLFFLKKA
jgi:SAM-dependent methyltransferase